MMKHVGLKLRRIDSSRGSAQTVGRRDRQREEDERWKKTSVMKWKKPSVRGNNVYAATCMWECFGVFLWAPVSDFQGFACFFKRGSSLSLSALTASTSLPLSRSLSSLSASLSRSLPSSPLPPGLVERWANMSLCLCKSNWRQAFTGMTWRWVAKSFQPSCLRLAPLSLSSCTVLRTEAAAAAAEAGSAQTTHPRKRPWQP